MLQEAKGLGQGDKKIPSSPVMTGKDRMFRIYLHFSELTQEDLGMWTYEMNKESTVMLGLAFIPKYQLSTGEERQKRGTNK